MKDDLDITTKKQNISVSYKDLPDTITPYDYAAWRRIGENSAREAFNSIGFPKLTHAGTKQLADKRAVLLFDLGLSEKDRQLILKEIAKEIIKNEVITNEERKNIFETIAVDC